MECACVWVWDRRGVSEGDIVWLRRLWVAVSGSSASGVCVLGLMSHVRCHTMTAVPWLPGLHACALGLLVACIDSGSMAARTCTCKACALGLVGAACALGQPVWAPGPTKRGKVPCLDLKTFSQKHIACGPEVLPRAAEPCIGVIYVF